MNVPKQFKKISNKRKKEIIKNTNNRFAQAYAISCEEQVLNALKKAEWEYVIVEIRHSKQGLFQYFVTEGTADTGDNRLNLISLIEAKLVEMKRVLNEELNNTPTTVQEMVN